MDERVVAKKLSYREAKAAARALRRTRANERTVKFVDASTAGGATSAAPNDSTPFLVLAGSLGLHGTALGLLLLIAPRHADAPHDAEPIRVEVLEREEPKPPVEVTHEIPLPQVKSPPPPVQKVAAPVEPTREEPPPDPIDIPPVAPQPTEAERPARRVIGLSMESVTTAGAAPAFATGNTRMGQTAGTADDPGGAGKLTPTLVPAKRTNAVQPTYPAGLRSGGVEGDVGLRAEIDAAGRVTAVTVTLPSSHEEFNQAARDAALASSYEPARANGVAVPQAIDFTVRFRLRP